MASACPLPPVLNGPVPLQVWRGESGGELFDVFDLSQTNVGIGFFFAERQDHAQMYAGRGTSARAFHLGASRVLDLTDPYGRHLQSFLAEFAAEFDSWVDRYSGEPVSVHECLDGGSLYDYEGTGSGERWNALFRCAWSAGYDAVRVLDATDGVDLGVVWVVSAAHQITFVPSAVAEEVGTPRPRRLRR